MKRITWIDFKITCVQAALKTLVETLAHVLLAGTCQVKPKPVGRGLPPCGFHEVEVLSGSLLTIRAGE